MGFLSQTIAQYAKISSQCLAEVESKFSLIDLPRKEKLVQAGEVSNKLALIERGFVRMYNIDQSGKETTVWIGGSGKFITSISSFVDQKPSYWTIEAVSDSKLHIIKSDSHFELCRKYPAWLEFENQLLVKAINALEYRTFELASRKAEERYQHFFERNPQFFLNIPAKHIASLLGISEETLSRLKKID